MSGDQRGFTLLEMIISMLMVGAIVLMIYSSYSMVVRTWDRHQEQIAELRLEMVGDRLLTEDWEQMGSYAFSVQGEGFQFLYGSPTRMAYVTRHGLGGVRNVDGRLFFTLLMIEPKDDGVALYCYKSDVPELELFELVRLYQTAGEGRRAAPLEAGLMERAILLKEGDEAFFSYDFALGRPGEFDDEDDVVLPLPVPMWRDSKPPRRIRLMTLRDEEFLVLDGAPRTQAHFGNASAWGGPQ